jgi:pimeloyl-ACP methyl ester carboxylesterase
MRVTPPAGAAWPDWWVAGWLTVPERLRRRELQIMLHGAGYDHRYWDWPLRPGDYSYVHWASAHGRATLNVDRVGAGASSRPPGGENTVSAQAEALHEIVQAARSGLLGSAPFERVVLVGHSLGSVIAGTEAAAFRDVDAVVLTGYVPVEGSAEGSRRQEEGFAPAVEALPHLRGLVDDDYLALPAGVRDWLLYQSDAADAEVIALDEQIKGVTTRGELRDAGAAGRSILTLTLPTLVLAGQFDKLLVKRALGDADCHDTMRRVAADLPTTFEFAVADGSGHNVNLHHGAHRAYELIDRWLDETAGAPPETD